MYDQSVIEEMRGRIVARSFYDELEKIGGSVRAILKPAFKPKRPAGIPSHVWNTYSPGGQQVAVRGAKKKLRSPAAISPKQTIGPASKKKKLLKKKGPDMSDWQRYGAPTAAGAGGLSGGYVLGSSSD